ncbi:MAG: hypothetical protein Q8S92_22845 [Hydrogenophaga sp.]|uniref:hypothetical protein n=1 Tax=Hydrogenophaga sp. TaxID=1904254 RepID=UPI002736A84E|nr:hypothetical protein [Hydrogenophaga sp.]MDP3351833.1 hypothetical protein [Hydrogenophaga sp.]
MNGQEIALINPVQAHAALNKVAWPWIKAMTGAGHKLVLEVRLAEDVKTDKQRRYLHGFVFKTIAEQAVVHGEKYPLKVWKEWYRGEFLGFKTVTYRNPITGKKSRRRERQSTEQLGVKGYRDYIERVLAHATTELGVDFPERWVDPETGEIYLLSDQRQRRAARQQQRETEAAS